jgi:hypothetical protein
MFRALKRRIRDIRTLNRLCHRMPRRSVRLAALGVTAAASSALAQSPDTFIARLSFVPISIAELGEVGGEGTATATLSRSRLSIEGAFEGLPAPATTARLHLGAATGASGPAIAELTITHAAAGSLKAEVALDREQRAALLAGHLYVQLHAQRGVPPDNAVLRGWLLAPRTSSPSRRQR